jgi:hypothetical protein
MDAGLGIGVALHADGLAGAFAGTGVGLGALAADGQTAHVADAAIAFDALQALEVHADLAAQIAFDDVFAFLDGVDDLGELLLGQILGADGRVNIRAFEDLLRVNGADAIDIAERDINALVRRYFNTNDACHKFLTLPLFVTFVGANDADNAAAAHHFAVLTHFLYRCPDFHFNFFVSTKIRPVLKS